MIDKQKIYDATNGGLDVFAYLWDDARRIISKGETTKAFKIRMDERTGSAHLKLKGDHWVATDFGDDGQARNCFDWVIKEHHLSGFKEAVAWIVTNLNLTIDDITPERNKPLRIEKEETAAPEGSVQFEVREGHQFTKRELEVFGDLVTQEVMDSLHWLPVTWVGTVKNGQITKIYSSDDYPVYARECIVSDAKLEVKDRFYKIYKPLEFKKQYRFMVSGQRPRNYINGLYELRQAYQKFKTQQQKEFDADPANDGKELTFEKLKGAVMASGERDAAAVRALGGFPIWLNSETDELEPYEESIIRQCAQTIYNIPDLDETGIRRGQYHALRHLDIRTIWLPTWFQKYRDARHNFRKDFKDFTEVVENEQQTFNRLLDQALPATFWTKTVQKNGKERYEVNSVCLLYFLRLQGFHKLRDKESGETTYIRLRGNVAERVTTADMAEFLIRWSQGKELIPGSGEKMSDVQPHVIQNLIIDSPKCSPSALEKVDTIELDFTSYTPQEQYFFFENGTVRVTAKDIELIPKRDSDKLKFFVWKDQIIPHKFTPLPPMFKAERKRNDVTDKDDWSVDIRPGGETGSDAPWRPKSNIMGYLINSSRLFWQKEMELPFAGRSDADEMRRIYRREHLFEITSPMLSEMENQKQMQCLANKLFIIGYFGWGYKMQSRAYAAFAMDWKLDEMGEANGGTGKSFLFEQALPKLIDALKLDGKQKKLADSDFKFSGVTRRTRMVLIDDLYKDFPFDTFFSNITGSLTVNPKNLNPFNIPFAQSPKFAFTTNFVPKIFDGSSERRMLYMVNSDYYHSMTSEDNQYHETRTIRDDFDRELLGDTYPEEDWNADYNLMLQCVQFYMRQVQAGVKIQPPMDNILLRSSRLAMADKFTEWAQEYFGPRSGHLNTLIKRDDAIDDFRVKCNMKDITTNAFFRKMRAFVNWCSYVECFNPDEYCAPSKPGHIIKREPLADGTGSGVPVEWIFVRPNHDILNRILKEQDEAETKLDVLPTGNLFLESEDKPF
ncbi:MAG: hypothetical protein IJK46_05985 [Prevotella sp.]|nr:hypothetical protein [Prevotella sp.]